MHSRSFLSRTDSTPRASAAQHGPDAHHPLGFADVRTVTPLGEPQPARGPLGFAAPEPRFVTELSFRRTGVPRTAAVAGPADETPASALPVGQAAWRPAAQAPDEVVETAPAAPVAEVPSEQAEQPEHVPFYKREITLRRRKRSEAEAPVADEPVSMSADEPDADDTAAEPEQQQQPFGFAAPLDDEDAVHVAEDETEVVEEPVAEAQAEAEELEADDAEVEEIALPVADEPVADADVLDEDEPTAALDHELSDDGDADVAGRVLAYFDDPQAASGPDLAAEATGEPVSAVAAEHQDDLEAQEDESHPSPADDTADADGSVEDAADVAALADADDDAAQADTTEPVADEPVAEPTDEAQDEVVDDLPLFVEDEPAGDSRKARRSLRSRRGASAPKPKPTRSKGARAGRRVVGLKIGASQLAAAVVARDGERSHLVTLARTPLEPGIVVDGDVRDPEALQTALHDFFEEHKLPRRDVCVGVASNRIGVRTVDIAGIDDPERFDNAVRFKAHEVLPVSFSESVLDYRIVEERATESGDVTKRVLLVVAPKDQVQPFVGACTAAGIRLAGVDLEALGLLRAFVPPQAAGTRLATDTATVVVAIGHESTTLLVSGGGTCEFTRVFDWGGLALQLAIAQELDVHTADAGKILHGLSLVGPGTGSLDEDMRARALDAVRTRLTPFARELVSSLQFYQGQAGSLGIGEIVITGGTSHLEGLADALHQMIGVSVRVGDPLQRLDVREALDPELERVIGSFAVPVGLAIEDVPPRGVNLLPDELRARRKRPSPLKLALPVAAVVPLAAMGFLFAQANGDASSQQDRLTAVQAQIDALPQPTRPVIDPTLALDQQQRAAALASVLGGRLAWDRVLGDVARVLPADVWLTKLSAQLPDPAAASLPAAVQAATPSVPSTPTGVSIEGYTFSVTDVAKLLARLGTVPSLTNVTLGQSEQKDVGKRKAVGFTIIADIQGNGGAQ